MLFFTKEKMQRRRREGLIGFGRPLHYRLLESIPSTQLEQFEELGRGEENDEEALDILNFNGPFPRIDLGIPMSDIIRRLVSAAIGIIQMRERGDRARIALEKDGILPYLFKVLLYTLDKVISTTRRERGAYDAFARQRGGSPDLASHEFYISGAAKENGLFAVYGWLNLAFELVSITGGAVEALADRREWSRTIYREFWQALRSKWIELRRNGAVLRIHAFSDVFYGRDYEDLIRAVDWLSELFDKFLRGNDTDKTGAVMNAFMHDNFMHGARGGKNAIPGLAVQDIMGFLPLVHIDKLHDYGQRETYAWLEVPESFEDMERRELHPDEWNRVANVRVPLPLPPLQRPMLTWHTGEKRRRNDE